MTLEAAIELSQKVGLPAIIVLGGAFVVVKLCVMLIRAVIESYKERIAALDVDRLHFRDRAEAHDDRTNGLCQSMIADLRRPGTQRDTPAGEGDER